MTDPELGELGRLERKGELSVLRFTRHLPHPPAKVWRALTEAEHLAGWFPTTIQGQHEPGSPLVFEFLHIAIESMSGEMLAFEPYSLLEFRWSDDTLRFELRPEGDGTMLEFTVTFPEHGKAARDGAGWHVCLEQLAIVVDGGAPIGDDPDRWRNVQPAYVASLGPEASSIGPPEEWERVHGE